MNLPALNEGMSIANNVTSLVTTISSNHDVRPTKKRARIAVYTAKSLGYVNYLTDTLNLNDKEDQEYINALKYALVRGAVQDMSEA